MSGTPPVRVEPPDTRIPSLPPAFIRAATSKRLSPAGMPAMPWSTLVWQWSQDSAQADPVTDTGRNRRGLAGVHSGVLHCLSPGA